MPGGSSLAATALQQAGIFPAAASAIGMEYPRWVISPRRESPGSLFRYIHACPLVVVGFAISPYDLARARH